MPDVRLLSEKLRKVARDPDMLRRFALEQTRRRYARYQDWRTFAGSRRRMLAVATRAPATPVPSDGPFAIHTLLGAKGLADSLYTLQHLYRLLPEPPPLVFHEDGSLGDAHTALLRRLFPGCRIILRADADREVLGELRARGLSHCEDFRWRSVMGLKLFDLQWYAAGRRAWYVDTDVAFFERPTAILDALARRDDEFVDRYNEDVDTFYSWTADQVREAFGITYPARPVNAGMVVIHRPALRWDVLNACFEFPQRTFWDEQTLWAVDFGAGRGEVLPPVYDVCFRHAWADMDRVACEREVVPGRPVVSQHFCGGPTYRRLFYKQMLQARAGAAPAAS